MAVRYVHRYSQGNAECLSGICVAVEVAKVKDRNYLVTHKYVIMVVVGERYESLQIMLPRKEVAGCLSVITRRFRQQKLEVT